MRNITLFIALFAFYGVLKCQIKEQIHSKRYVTCEIVQRCDSIKIIPNKEYLKGTLYWETLLKSDKNKFKSVFEAISYMGSYGWKNVRTYVDSVQVNHFVMQTDCSPYDVNSDNLLLWKNIISGNSK